MRKRDRLFFHLPDYGMNVDRGDAIFAGGGGGNGQTLHTRAWLDPICALTGIQNGSKSRSFTETCCEQGIFCTASGDPLDRGEPQRIKDVLPDVSSLAAG
jgi:hypothetical protein